MADRHINVIIGGNAAGASAAAKAGSAALKTFADGTVGHFRRVSGAVLNLRTLLAGGLLGGTVAKLTSFGDQIDKQSQRVAVSAEEFQVLSHAFTLGGSGAEAVETSFRSLTARILDLQTGSTEVARTFDMLGLSLADLQGKTPLDQFRTVMVALGGIKDSSTRAALAQEAFGRSGLALLPVLNSTGGNLDILANKMRRNGQLLSDEQIRKSAQFKDALADLNRAILAGAWDALESQIGDVTKAINDLVESGKIKEFAASSAEAIQKLWDVLRGLASFIREHRSALETLGISYIAFRTLESARIAVMALRTEMLALQAAAVAAGTQMSLTSAAASSMGAPIVVAGIAGLVTITWQLVDALREAEQAAKDVPGFVEEATKVSGWTKAAWFLSPALGGFLELRDRIGTGAGESKDPTIDAAIADEEARKKREEDRKKRIAAAERIAKMEADAIRLAGEAEIAARSAAAAAVEAEIQAEIDRRKALGDAKIKLADEQAKLEDQQRKDAAAEQYEAEAKRLEKRKQNSDKLLAEMEQEAKDLKTAAEDAWKAAVHPVDRATRKQQKKEAHEEERAQAAAERRLKRARAQEERWIKSGVPADKARKRLSKQSEELLAADDQRKVAAEAETNLAKARQQAETDAANAQAARAAADQAFADATGATTDKLAGLGAAADGFRDSIKTLQDQIGALEKAQPKADVGSMDDAALAGAAAKAKEIAATDPKLIAQQGARAAILGEVMMGGAGAAPAAAVAGISGVPAAIPGAPAVPNPPQAGNPILAELQRHTALLVKIEANGGLA